MDTIIRGLKPEDYDHWLVLWDANNQGHVNQAVTNSTWERLIENQQVCGLGAFQDNRMVGLVHYILHPVTGHLKPVCYMQDLFIDPQHRRKGIGRQLVAALATQGRKEGWARLYWLAEEKNKEAQSLYKNLGLKLDFTLHVLPL
ncbi:MAG: GNAT family N-acetyltransferase [Micavibrio aeruginosavorus]|uniref:GNAT family N-acetyltransferase n=1 Tax=Micavibrio aeruginosavorus TaxID=349221 RepID=A0A7T5R2Z9_9BACT|nr:MAG: GNAT family N-acetyltransferase [Micavibrio aeruginosavorus]